MYCNLQYICQLTPCACDVGIHSISHHQRDEVIIVHNTYCLHFIWFESLDGKISNITYVAGQMKIKLLKNTDILIKAYSNKHNAELQRTDPGTKVTGEFSTRGHIFSPNV